jgi:hypothetical protein
MCNKLNSRQMLHVLQQQQQPQLQQGWQGVSARLPAAVPAALGQCNILAVKRTTQ